MVNLTVKTKLKLIVLVLLPMFSFHLGFAAQTLTTRVTYEAYRFEDSEGWHVTAAGNRGTTALQGRTWKWDFSQGAQWLGLTLPDRCLFTRPERFRLRFKGDAAGHPVYVSLRTHFMTFHKILGELKGTGEQEFVFEAPPGDGWEWRGGENDGKLHGPLRLGEIRLMKGARADAGTLELLSLSVEGQCPEDKLVAGSAMYSPDKGGEFRTVLHWLGKTNTPAQVECIVRDWDQRELTHTRKSVLLKPGALPQLETFSALEPLSRKLRFMEAEIRVEVGGQSIKPLHAYWLAATQPQRNAELRPYSPFGMGVYLGRFSLEQMEEVARKARDAGVKWSREDFSWQRIEPRAGEYHWDYYDRLVDCARRNGISVYAIVGYWADWSKSYTPEGVDQYVGYARQLVRRYKDRIHYWEIWNEPNIFFWQGPKELYAELLKKSYAAIKEEDPTAQVLGISTAGIDTKFIDKMQQLGAPFDILTIHPYRSKFDDQEFIAELKKVSDQVRLPDGKRRPVWLTEMGWATHTPHHVLGQDFQPFTEREQAELIARVYLCSIVSGIDPRTFWYDFRNDGSDPFYFEHHMGIMRQDGTPKPAYTVYANLARVLEGLAFVGKIELPAGNYGFRFSNTAGSKQVIALWNPKAASRLEVTAPQGRTTLVNAVGEESPVKAIDQGQKKVIAVDVHPGSVVYLVSEEP